MNVPTRLHCVQGAAWSWMTEDCRREYQRIGLHLHDLRRESGSRLLEVGTDPHILQQFLGHANVKTTSRYLVPHLSAMERAVAKAQEARKAAERAAEQEHERSMSGKQVANSGAVENQASESAASNSVN